MQDTATLGVVRAKNNPSDPGKTDGGGAHRTGFECHIKLVIRNALRLFMQAGAADDLDLGMSRGVGGSDGIVSATKNLPGLGVDQHCANRHFCTIACFARFRQG